MKTKVLLATLALMMFSVSASAQRGSQQRGSFSGESRGTCMNIPDLSEKQIEEIGKLRLSHMEERTNHRNRVAQLRMEIRALTTGENRDPARAEELTDELAALKAEMMKKSLQHREQVRGLLTKEQQVYFDARQSNRSGMRSGRGSCDRGYGANDRRGGRGGRGR